MMTVAELIWKGTKPSCLPIFKKMPPDSLGSVSYCIRTMTQNSQGMYKGKEMESLRLLKSISRFKSNWTWISPAEEERNGRNSPKQATVGIGCIKGLGKYFKGWDQESGDIYGSKTHCCDLCARDLQLNNIFYSFISTLCSTVPILMLTSISGTLKVLFFLFGKKCMLKRLIIKCDIL